MGDLRVALGGGPVAGGLVVRAEAERIDQGNRIDELGPRQETGRDEVEHQEHDDADVGPHHRARGRRDREEPCAGDEQRRHAEQQIDVSVVPQVERPEHLGIEPRHRGAEDHAERRAQEQQATCQERAREATEQVVEARQACRMNDGAESGLVVAHHDVGDERRQDEDRKDGHDHQRLGDGVGRVLPDVATGPDLHVVGCGGGEREQQEDGKGHPERG